MRRSLPSGIRGSRGCHREVRFCQSQQDQLLGSLTGGGVIGTLPKRYPVVANPANWSGRKLLRLLRDRQAANEKHRLETRTRWFPSEQVYETQRHLIYQTRKAITDGASPREFPLITAAGPARSPTAEMTKPGRISALSIIDRNWSSHLDDLRRLQEDANWLDTNRGHLQHYAAKATAAFEAMLVRGSVRREIAATGFLV